MQSLILPIDAYIHVIPNGTLMTKKRFLAKLRNRPEFENDSRLKWIYQVCIESPFKSLMRVNNRINFNF